LLPFSGATWCDIKQYVQKKSSCILTVGSYEQHGQHLPLATDILIPLSLAKELKRRTDTFCFPPVSVGLSDCHLFFPGTLSLRADTFYCLLTDILLSIYSHGFTHCLIINGHGGNTPVIQDVIAHLSSASPACKTSLFEWWNDKNVQAYMSEVWNEQEYHASAPETSLMLYLHPELVDMAKASGHPVNQSTLTPDARQFYEWYPSGSAGIHPHLASAVHGEKIYRYSISACLRLLPSV